MPSSLLPFPTATDHTNLNPNYVTILLQVPVLITIRHTLLPFLDELLQKSREDKLPPAEDLAQLVCLILDHLSDANVDAAIDVRGRIATLRCLPVPAGCSSSAWWRDGSIWICHPPGHRP